MARPDATKPDPGPVYHATGWRVPLLWLLAVVVKAWCRTLRYEVNASELAAARDGPAPVTIMLWHNRLFVVPSMVRMAWSHRPIYALVSASRDGADLSKFFSYVGLRTVRGSSSRFGREALQELIALQRSGRDIAITPDGPRGPVFQLKAGAVLAARRTRSPIVLFGLEFHNAWTVRSWDRFRIPKPFSRVSIRPERIAPDAIGRGVEGVEKIRRRLLELSGESPEAWPRLIEADVASEDAVA